MFFLLNHFQQITHSKMNSIKIARYNCLFKILSSTSMNNRLSTVSILPTTQSETVNTPEVLTDTHGRFHNYLRISLTEKCNLRCQYCMPEDGVSLTKNDELLTTEEMIGLAKLFIQQGVDKIRLTGGEPLIRKDIEQICYDLTSIDGLKSLGITTNGLVGKRKFPSLAQAGVTHVNISLDTLVPQKFEFISRRKGWQHVMNAIDTALQLPFQSVKVNCVVMKGLNDDELLPFVELTKDKDVEIRFIEYMPFDGNKWNFEKFVPFDEMMLRIKEKFPDIYKISDQSNDTSKGFKVPDFKGRVGFITSMSKNFCSSCNRLRLTADGNLKACLFGPMEVSLRDQLRQGVDEERLLQIISSAVNKKKKRHAARRTWRTGLQRQQLLLKTQRMDFLLSCSNHNIFDTRGMHTRSETMTHVTSDGSVKMVDVADKIDSHRIARASARVRLDRDIVTSIKNNLTKKGDVLSVAKIAGIMAAKETSTLIPLCHNIPLSSVNIEITIDGDDCVHIIGVAKTTGKTGVEMEALTAVSIAALTVYDMCKSMSHDIVIETIQLDQKLGGKSSFER